MSDRALRLWYGGALTSASSPERVASTAWALDRWLMAVRGRWSMRFDLFERRRLRKAAARIVVISEALKGCSGADLDDRIARLRHALRAEGMTRASTEEAFALVREVSRRVLAKPHYPVQLMGGLSLLNGCLAEMATGEGKTLTALLPVVTVALAEVPVHVVTVNDYLARRDADILRPVFQVFGLSVGVVTHLQSDEQRRAAYDCDIVYCVNKDLVFDFLRDGLDAGHSVLTSERRRGRQNGLYYALIDEADSVLIDEARTPLVIAQERPDPNGGADVARALDIAARLLASRHYVKDDVARHVRLTGDGRVQVTLLTALDAGLWGIAKVREERVEQALTAHFFFRRGENYVVRDDKVHIVDEFTGRILPDRTWEHGLHQTIEMIEGCKASLPRETIARQTYPRFFARYLRVAGMSGTAAEVAAELGAEYGLRVIRIPPNRRCLRRSLGVRCFLSTTSRWRHVAKRAIEVASTGRAVLIGTRSVAASETIALELTRLGEDAVVLNALQDEHEAEIVAQAGTRGRVTIATNMAGRGTDILLDEDVKANGGLHVILTEFHETPRVDRQLVGRAARQGDPGSCEACVCLDDELFATFARFEVALLRRCLREDRILGRHVTGALRRLAQWRAERRNAAIRRSAIRHDRQRGDALAFTGAAE